MSYSSINLHIWDDPIFSELELKEKFFLLYLYTCPAQDMCGIYGLALKNAATHTGLKKEKISKLLEKLQLKGLIKWDEGQKVVWIKDYLRLQLANHKNAIGANSDDEEVQAGTRVSFTETEKTQKIDKRLIHLKKLYRDNPQWPFWDEFFSYNASQLAEFMHIIKPVRKTVNPNLPGQAQRRY